MSKVFLSYSHSDETFRNQLDKQLSLLKRQGIIDIWHDRLIGGGEELNREISTHLESANIILLLVSADFLASDYCYEREMIRAMERHESGDAIVIPVILRACDWHGAPFGKLMAAPSDGLPITQWIDRDQGFLDVTRVIRSAAARKKNHNELAITSEITDFGNSKKKSSEQLNKDIIGTEWRIFYSTLRGYRDVKLLSGGKARWRPDGFLSAWGAAEWSLNDKHLILFIFDNAGVKFSKYSLELESDRMFGWLDHLGTNISNDQHVHGEKLQVKK